MNGRRRRTGFTLIELLTVIAIIAILVAILFPVFAKVRTKVQEDACMSNMHQLSQALQMYKDTWDRYPIALGHFTCANVNPPPLYFPLAQFLKSEGVLRCPLNAAPPDGNAPLASQNWKQPIKWFPNTSGVPYVYPPPPAAGCAMTFPARESYDAQWVPNDRSAGTFEVHYTPNWSEQPPSSGDFPRQLKYRSPAPTTVVTWCLNHADVNNVGEASGFALVLFLDGTVRKKRAEDFSRSRWASQQPPFSVVP